ncbi:Threonine/homoserine/homoserine lactone efflux protein [Roseateles sp. YR242]|uniref:LysE family translocator n=1 Tax=Roseateles sp. YR242 TaxID=1855305 RepID=UPI0008B4CF00|nr:LysE family translocator [Roseateles sp. YR242]SEL89124.1 Threonine/homoserine/homoserine lactone efflux protein [Roseateles sp. YR242]
MALHTWLVYLLTVVGLSLTPGPNSLLVLSHGALHGHRRACFTVAGGAVGFIALIGLSMLGIGALLQTMAGALTALKIVGGAYLCWLGFKLWRAPAIELDTTEASTSGDARRRTLFRQGLFAAISNPKVLLFYGAFLPQFIDPTRSLLMQFAVMAATFALIEGVVEYLLVRLAYRIRPWLRTWGRQFNRVCGGMFGVLGVALPFTR